MRIRERSRRDRRHRRQSRDGKRRASRVASEFQIRVSKFFDARRITRLRVSHLRWSSDESRRRGRQRMMRTLPGSQPCPATEGLRQKKRSGVRTCRAPCLERLLSQRFNSLSKHCYSERLPKRTVIVMRRLRCLQLGRQSVCQPDRCQLQVRASLGYRYTGSYRFGSLSLCQRCRRKLTR